MNEELNKAMEQISDKHIAEAAAYHNKRRRPYWVAAVAAVLVVAISVGVFFKKTHDKKVQHSQPSSYFYFDSFAEIYGLIDAYELSDDQFYDYVRSMKFRPYCDTPTLREGVKDLEAFIERIPLPYCDAEELAIYYYLYADALEIFCDTQGIRYRFLINTSFKEYSGDPVFTTSLSGYPLDMYLVDERLCGNLKIDGVGVWVSVFTDNPDEVDFSVFSLEDFSPVDDTEPSPDPGPLIVPLGNVLAEPEYPEMVPFPDPNSPNVDFRDWKESQKNQYDQPDGYADSLHTFFRKSLPIFLETAKEENVVCSPVNIYMALAMLAECTAGNSRQQILNLLGAASIESLREQASHVWNAHYCSDGYTTLQLGNSLWLDSEEEYFQKCIDTLANDYYASVFWGDLGSWEMNQHLRSWINEQTGGMLEEQANALELDPMTVVALASTIEYRVAWTDSFKEVKNTQQTFHSTNNNVTATFMNQRFERSFYWGENFTGTYLNLEDNGKMWLFLPDEGISTSELLNSSSIVPLILNEKSDILASSATVNLSLPKFDIAYNTDLVEDMQSLGVTDVFSFDKADMSNITTATKQFSPRNTAVTEINHDARVTIDEDGLRAVAYTVIEAPSYGMPGTPPKEVDFILDRPFVFVITSRDGLPLFTGVVEQP